MSQAVIQDKIINANSALVRVVKDNTRPNKPNKVHDMKRTVSFALKQDQG